MSKQIILSFFTIFISFLVGCGNSKAENEIITSSEKPAWELNKEEITLDWYINYSWYTTPWGQNIVSKAITEDTGVSIKFIVPTGSETQKLNAMIASDTLPDLITLGWWEPQAQTMINNGMVYALNELADQYDPYFYSVADKQVISWYTKEDGNIYGYPNSSFTPQDVKEGKLMGSNQNFLVRKDIYEAIGSPDMTTKEGFVEAIKLAAEMFPEVDGEPLIPIGSDEFTEEGCNSFDKYLMNFLAVPYEKDGVFYDRYLDEEYIAWLKVFRSLNEQGYLSEEIFIDKRTQLEEKMADGRYFCLIYQGSDIQVAQRMRNAIDPNTIYIAVEGPRNTKGDDPVLSSGGINGWTLTFISKNCKYPERAISFINYLMSERGQKMICLGVEGVTYDVIDGKYVVKEEVEDLNQKDRAEYDRIYGADDAYWMFQNNVMQNQWIQKDDELQGALMEWAKPYTHYVSQYDMFFESDSPYANIFMNIEHEWGKTLPILLLSKSEEEFDEYLHKYRETKYELGYEKLLGEFTRKMEEAKNKLGLE